MNKQRFNHLMLDLETLSTGSNAVICSIAAVPFDLDGRRSDYFSQNIDIQSCLDAGLQVSGDTIYWWLEQSEEARQALLQYRRPLPQVLLNLVAFIAIEMEDDYKIWGKGPSFDCGKLADAYRACKINIPWKYNNERCVRTVTDGYEESLKTKLPFEGVPHVAEDDAIHQVKQLQEVWKWKNDSDIKSFEPSEKPRDQIEDMTRDSLMQKIASGICVSILTVDRCPYCVDTCEASKNRPSPTRQTSTVDGHKA